MIPCENDICMVQHNTGMGRMQAINFLRARHDLQRRAWRPLVRNP